MFIFTTPETWKLEYPHGKRTERLEELVFHKLGPLASLEFE